MTNLFPVKDLQDRYQIGMQAEINRRSHLGITTIKVDGSSYITQKDLELLDALDNFLKTPGAKMADFNKGDLVKSDSLTMDAQLEIIPNSNELLTQEYIPGLMESTPETLKILIRETVQSTVSALVEVINPSNPIAHWEKLKIAADEGFWLTSKEVKQLTGTKPVLRSGETTWQRGCFTFQKAGKIGGQTAWKVEKI